MKRVPIVFFTERRHSEQSEVGLTGCYETPPIAQAEVRFECLDRGHAEKAALKAHLPCHLQAIYGLMVTLTRDSSGDTSTFDTSVRTPISLCRRRAGAPFLLTAAHDRLPRAAREGNAHAAQKEA